MKISIIGSGWVGENTGKGLITLGHQVIFHDISDIRVKELQDEGLQATGDLEEAVLEGEASFICVPTPNIRGEMDLRYIERVSKNLGYCLGKKEGYHLVVVKSTVLPRTTRQVVIPLMERKSNQKVDRDFGVCVNPEFMTEISKTWTKDGEFVLDFFSGNRIVIGEHDEKAGNMLERIYQDMDAPVVRTDLETAEMIKYASNCMLATKISYWNEIYLICKELEVDSEKVANTVAMDPRIGKYGTVHGKAFGGKCLPKDLRALINFSKKRLGQEVKLLQAVKEVNKYIAEKYGVRE